MHFNEPTSATESANTIGGASSTAGAGAAGGGGSVSPTPNGSPSDSSVGVQFEPAGGAESTSDAV